MIIHHLRQFFAIFTTKLQQSVKNTPLSNRRLQQKCICLHCCEFCVLKFCTKSRNDYQGDVDDKRKDNKSATDKKDSCNDDDDDDDDK